jgi:CRP/FNR family transcriptional regulator
MNPDRLTLHRPELISSLLRGDAKLCALMKDSAQLVPAGKVLIRADTEHDYIYRLRSGWACRNRSVADGRGQFILIFLPGDVFAVKGMFLARHPDSVQVLSQAVVERLHYTTLRAAYSSDGDIANRCMWQMIEEERRLHSWVFGLGQGCADERLALLLVDLRGRLALAGTIAEGALTFELPLTQAQLADHLGITPIHVNRTVKAFRERGIAVIRNGRVTISDLAELLRIAEPLMDSYERTTSQYGLVDSRPRRRQLP